MTEEDEAFEELEAAQKRMRHATRVLDTLAGMTPMGKNMYPPLNDVTNSANDRQEGGDHYVRHKIQPWDAMEAWFSHEEFAGFLRGNCIKYVARYKDKNGVEDLKKARHYLDKLIEVLTQKGG